MMKKRSCVLCVIFLVLVMICMNSCSQKALVDIQYTFEGAHAEEAGYAQGTITLTPTQDNPRKDGYYLLYFAEKGGLLSGYDEFASIPITGESVTYTVKDATLLPPDATALVVFESDARFLDEQPDYQTRAGSIKLPKDKRLKLSKDAYTFGAISDVHMNYEPYNRGPYQKWEKALNFFAQQQTDDVIVTGDMTGDEHEGTLDAQYKKYLSIIDASDYPAEHIFEGIGNHGNTEIGREQFVRYTANAEQVHPFEGSAWFYVLREGQSRDNLFLFMAQELKAPGDSPSYDNFSKAQIDWVAQTLNEFSGTDTNIFIILHSPFLNYGAGDRHPGGYTGMITFKPQYFQTMRLKKLLESHKDVIVLSGHSHLSLYDNENYSDENGTSCRMIHLGSGCQPNSYGTGETFTRNTDGRYEVTPEYGSEAYTVAVYDEYIVFTGRNLATGKIIPSACYLLPTVTEEAE